jgi:hypothetical protein
LIAAVVGANLGLVFVILRLVGCRRLQALAFSALAAATAASVFWSIVPETYQFGALSILLALTVVALDARRRIAPGWYLVISALTMSFTITNWMTGLAATHNRFGWWRALNISVAVFGAVTVLWGVQKLFFPTAAFFLGDPLRAQFITPYESQPAAVLRAFLGHSVVMPAIGSLEVPWWIPQLSVQGSPILSNGWRGLLLVAGWWTMLVFGIWGLIRTKWRDGICFVLLATIFGQLVLHLLFGRETFLYSAHFTPLLVILSAFSVFTPLRSAAAGLAIVLAVAAGANNLDRLGDALDLLQDRLLTPRNLTRAAMRARPADAWPRGEGHVLLGWPGSPEARKAYHEPGGSFSPSVGAFGVSVWVVDQGRALVATSDAIPMNVIHQRFVTTGGMPVPAVVTETPFYRAAWSTPAPGRWVLELSTHPPTVLVVRSVGPAGGPITSLRWSGGRLTINDRWSLSIEPSPSSVHLGEEIDGGWKTADNQQTNVTSASGWAFARLELRGASRFLLTIDEPLNEPSPASSRPTASPLRLRVPDDDFVQSVEAQVNHLEMGVVGHETRPGDLSYPAPWPRDAAYTLVALARAGRGLTDVSALATGLAERDFFGGFGPEADAPGLALWALEETATLLGSAAYDKWLWPHARRKAELILEMLATPRALRRPAVEPIAPGLRSHPDLTLVAEPSSEGLIAGRVDWQKPVLYVNAISYRGLLDAARLAERRGETADADRWRAAARRLQTAWSHALGSVKAGEDHHAFTNGLWPTGMAVAARDAYRQKLDDRFSVRRDANGGYRAPVRSTYLEVAEAHQWLFAERADRVWSTLQWLWDHQASPGLYTWWKDAERDTADPFHRWDQIRGWVRPTHLTPDAWTAAEVLLLQLDMLAYTEEQPEPTIVIGGGVPRRWLESPLVVRGIRTRLGQVDWTWNTRSVDVQVSGKHAPVRLGGAFGRDVPVHVSFRER